MKLVWNDEKSVRAWLQNVSAAIRGIADMARSLADVVDSAMPPAEPASEAPGSTGGPETRACSVCGKSEAETQLYAGGKGSICAPCTRAACAALGIPLDEGKGKPSGR